ncbi:hypothetical protein AX660_09430 [Paraglaciecola hydrolytica]|uniref:Uncharacterized protein n=1 Tax=Paraglaciecola hydrolytica TaxID=1799789 RepID=A0A136A4Q1_9ALTE|nr:hypothetical protein AX660_09430 [Paraglaciecola hydrolytica]
MNGSPWKARLGADHHGRVYSEFKSGAISGLESWLESGVFWLLFGAVAKKYARQLGMAVEKRNGLR